MSIEDKWTVRYRYTINDNTSPKPANKNFASFPFIKGHNYRKVKPTLPKFMSIINRVFYVL